MMWRNASLLGETPTEQRDKLGNLVYKLSEPTQIKVRVAPLSLMVTQNEGNDYTGVDLLLLTLAPMDKTKAAKLLRFGGDIYEIVTVTDLGRRRAISCRRRKVVL